MHEFGALQHHPLADTSSVLLLNCNWELLMWLPDAVVVAHIQPLHRSVGVYSQLAVVPEQTGFYHARSYASSHACFTAPTDSSGAYSTSC